MNLDNSNEKKIIDTETDNNHKEVITEQSDEGSRIKHVLTYGIAMLSIVSFFTTSNGLQKLLVGEHNVTAYLISFGIQVLVLVIGSQLWKIINLFNQKESAHTFFRNLAIILIIITYIVSVMFSSVFSYVFIANAAYQNTRDTQYNIEIENFITEEIITLKEINRIEGNIILSNIQNYIPSFRNIESDIDNASNIDISKILETANLQKVTKPDFVITFDADTLSEYYQSHAGQTERLQATERTFISAKASLEQYYNNYSSIFDRVSSEMSIDDANAIIKEIEANKTLLLDLKTQIEELRDVYSDFNNIIQSNKNAFINNISTINGSYESLLSVCSQISSSNITQAENLNLNKLNLILYSPDEISDEELEETLQILQNLLDAYMSITNPTDYDDNIMKNLSSCISYLGEYQKHIKLNNEIDIFEKTVLNKVYVIEEETTTKAKSTKESTSEKEPSTSEETTIEDMNINQEYITNITTSSSEATEDIIEIDFVDPNEWNEIRRADLSRFISLLKTMPDVNVLLSLVSNSNDSDYEKALKDYENYQSETINTAYRFMRNKLEKISDIETALRFFNSDFRFMAIFCAFVSLFLDFAPFCVGTFKYFAEKKKDTDNINVNNQ